MFFFSSGLKIVVLIKYHPELKQEGCTSTILDLSLIMVFLFYLIKQHTPNPEAQLPSFDPPAVPQSSADMQVPS